MQPAKNKNIGMARKGKRKVLEGLEIERVASGGHCIARHEGQVIFVKDTVPGDVADVEVKGRKKNFLEGRPLRFHKRGPGYREPFCEHYNLCGGCKWQHLSYEEQLAFKQQEVKDQLDRIAKVQYPEVLPTLPAEPSKYYRNKLEYTFSNRRWLMPEEVSSQGKVDRNGVGFHIPGRFDKVVHIKHCWLQPEPSNALRLSLDGFARENNLVYYDIARKHGLLRNLIVRTSSTGQTMVIVQFGANEPENIQKVMEHMHKEFPDLTALLYTINLKGNETIHDLQVHIFAGQDHIEEEMEGLRFRIGPKSFYQTNSPQACQLYAIAREMAALTGAERVYDLYTGTGTIACFVARQAREVIGIEYVPEAIEDARRNAANNNLSNLRFFAGDMRELLLPDFLEEQGRPDVVITDPPRAGMDKEVVEVLLQAAPQRIVYISCNPSTQARDLALLDAAYAIKKVQPVDMFPHTHHVENIVLLELKK